MEKVTWIAVYNGLSTVFDGLRGIAFVGAFARFVVSTGAGAKL